MVVVGLHSPSVLKCSRISQQLAAGLGRPVLVVNVWYGLTNDSSGLYKLWSNHNQLLETDVMIYY